MISRWVSKYILRLCTILVVAIPLVGMAQEDRIEGIRWNIVGSELAIGYDSGLVEIFDVSSQQVTHTFQFSGRIQQPKWSPVDSHTLAVINNDITASTGFVRILDTVTGQEILSIEGGQAIDAIAWSPSGDRIAGAIGYYADSVSPRYIAIWNTLTGEVVASFPFHQDTITALDWSSPGDKLAGAATDNNITIWNPNTGEEIRVLEGHTFAVQALSWSPDGNRLASASMFNDKTVRLWDATTGQVTLTIVSSGGVDLTWNPQGTLLATADLSNAISIWDATTGMLVDTIAGSANIRAVDWSPDGEKVVYATEETTFSVEVVTQPFTVTSYTLINADTDQPIAGYDPIPDNAEINLTEIGTENITIEANVSGQAESVIFELNGSPYTTENGAPYAIASNSGSDYFAWMDYTLDTDYTLIATPYSQDGGQGTAGTPLTLHFRITDSSGGVNPLYRVNVGGPLLDVAGMDWAEDSQTNPYEHTWAGSGFGVDNETINPIPPGAPEALFQTYRASSAALTWGFPVNPGYYEVRLYFNESQHTAPDQRLMDIELEGQTFANDFDIYAAAGAQHAGIMRSYMVKVEDNTLNLKVVAIDTVNTRLHGIEIIPAVPDALYRVNNGGEQLLSDDASMPYWMEDNDDNETVFDTWPYSNSFGTASGTVTLLPSVPLYVPDQLFETHRFGSTNLYLDFPVPTGTYVVRLYVSEPVFDAAGQRLMSFGIDNDVYQPDLDVYATAGGKNRGMMLEYSAYISDGLLDIHAWAPWPITVPPSVSVLQGVEIIPQDMGALIQNVQVTGSSATYAWAPDADVGNLVYTDWSYEFTDLSSHVAGYEYIRTPNNDKMLSDPTYSLSFDLTAPATVYIAYDPRWNSDPNWDLPSWLSGWTLRGDVDVVTEDNQGQGIFNFAREVYSYSFPAGQVVLGGNNAPTVESTMYIVFAVPD